MRSCVLVFRVSVLDFPRPDHHPPGVLKREEEKERKKSDGCFLRGMLAGSRPSHMKEEEEDLYIYISESVGPGFIPLKYTCSLQSLPLFI